MSYALVDIETSGLNPYYHDVWEIGYILEPEGVEVEFTLPMRLERADPKALEINRYHERMNAGDVPGRVSLEQGAHILTQDWKGRSIIAQPTIFDLSFIRYWLHRCNVDETWSHRAVHDLKTFALGTLHRLDGDPPIRDLSGSDMAKIFGVPKPLDAHRALADARWTRDLARAMGAIPT